MVSSSGPLCRTTTWTPKDGDPAKISELRVEKDIAPWIFDANSTVEYAWKFNKGDEAQAAVVCKIATSLYQLGRGVDMAWAQARIAPPDDRISPLTRGSIDTAPQAHPAGRLFHWTAHVREPWKA